MPERLDKKYILESPLKVARLSRFIAKGLDLFIVLILSMFFYPVGVLLAIIYMSFADSLQNGQSIGKKIIGFSVVSLEDGGPCNIKQSFIRNLPILVPLFFSLIPLWGWALSLLLGAPLIGLEFYLLFKLDSGHRLGDVMADTTVMANDGNRVDIRKKKNSWFEPENVIPS